MTSTMSVDMKFPLQLNVLSVYAIDYDVIAGTLCYNPIVTSAIPPTKLPLLIRGIFVSHTKT